MSAALIKCLIVIFIIGGCGDGTGTQHQNAPIAEKIPVQCALSPDQIKSYQDQGASLDLIRQAVTSEPAYQSKTFAESLTLWQTCYETP